MEPLFLYGKIYNFLFHFIFFLVKMNPFYTINSIYTKTNKSDEEITMGILSRFKDIMSSNIHAFMKKNEDPEKVIDQILRNLRSDLGQVKAENASIIAEEQRCKRQLDECRSEIGKLKRYAAKAVEAGDEDGARAFLERKAALAGREAELDQAYNRAAANAVRMKELHHKLSSDIEALETRAAAIKDKLAAAKELDRKNEINGSGSGGHGLSALDRLDEKADQALREAEALAELRKTLDDEFEELMSKNAANDSNRDIDNELAELKKELKS